MVFRRIITNQFNPLCLIFGFQPEILLYLNVAFVVDLQRIIFAMYFELMILEILIIYANDVPVANRSTNICDFRQLASFKCLLILKSSGSNPY